MVRSLVWTNQGISQAASIYFTWLSAATGRHSMQRGYQWRVRG